MAKLATKTTKKSEKKSKEKEIPPDPPDGGWGWVIVVAYILAGVTIIPIIQNFGLIYKDRLQDLGLSSTDITFIISLNSSFGQICGVFQGPLLKKFGYRVMALFAVTSFSIGTFLTGLANSLPAFIVTHGMITSLGFTYSLTSFSIALNSYFKKNRSRAQGILMGFLGLGPIATPLLVNFCLDKYGTQWTAFLLAALNANGYVGALLLQPVAWHSKRRKVVEVPVEESKDEMYQADSHSIISANTYTLRRPSNVSGNHRYRSISESEDTHRKNSLDIIVKDEALMPLRHQSTLYLDGSDLAAAKSLLSIKAEEALLASVESLTALDYPEFHVPTVFITGELAEAEKESISEENQLEVVSNTEQTSLNFFRKCGRILVKAFDLDLLKDTTYIVIMMGLSIAIIGELIFSLLTPFILEELGLDMNKTALFMSITAGADIIARFLAPYAGDLFKHLFKFNSRSMYITALSVLVLARFSLLFAYSEALMYGAAGLIGTGKGFRTVFWAQVLPDYIPIHKLASAMSLQSLANGILIIFAGPLGGKLVEINNSYLNIIYFANVLALMTIILWTGDYLFRTRFHKKGVETDINA